MEDNKIQLSSQTLELSETSTYIEMTNRLCYYGEPNLNGIVLPVDTASDIAETLIDQPVVAKYKTIKGKPDLGGHEVSKLPNGEVKFGTEFIGVHTSVEVKDDTVEVQGVEKTLPCLFATCKIWKRNSNMVTAVKRLFSEGKLFSSWEILTSSYEVKDGLKYVKDYVFESNCLLGSKSFPAFGKCATALTLAETEENPEMLIAEALAIDIENINKKEDKDLNKDKKNTVVEGAEDNTTVQPIVSETPVVEPVIKTPETSETVVSDLTVCDLRNKIQELCRTKLKVWCYVDLMFPNEKYVLVETDNRTSQLEYTKFTYEVNGEEVTIGEPETIRLVVSVENINAEIASKNEAILSTNEEIKNLKATIEELTPYKEEAEKGEREKAEKELAEKQEGLKKYAIKSGYITSEEIETSEEIKLMISEVNETAIKALIVDRLMSGKEENVVASTKPEVETASLVSEETTPTDYKSVMKKFLGK